MEVSKKTAIILAFLFGFWAWLYTYSKDARKFWICLAVNFFFAAPIALIFHDSAVSKPQSGLAGESLAYSLIGGFVLLIPCWLLTWIAVLGDAFTRSKEQYTTFNIKNRKTLIPLSIIFGPFSYLCTYHKDWWKFWLSLVIIAAGLIVVPWLTSAGLYQIYKSSYAGLRMHLQGKVESCIWEYMKYYFSSVKLTSLLIPAIIWLGAVSNSIFRFIRWNVSSPPKGIA